VETFWVQGAILRAFPGLQAPSRESWAKAGIALPAVRQIVPKRVDALLAMQFPDHIRPALPDKSRVGRPALRLHQRVVVPFHEDVG
jgi:hypothetical protein